MKFVVLYNLISRRYEVYKTKDIERLRAALNEDYKESSGHDQEDEEDEDEEGEKGEKGVKGEKGENLEKRYFKKKGVSKLDLYQYNELKEIKEKA